MTRAKALLLSKGNAMPAMCEICKSSLPLTESRCGDCNGLELYSLDEIKAIKDEAYDTGVRYALEYLSDLIDGLDETDLWGEYMNEENN